MDKVDKTIVCMYWGDAYSIDYVNILYKSVQRNITPPARFICLSDRQEGFVEGIEVLPLPSMELSAKHLANGGWQKLGIFSSEFLARHNIKGRVLFLDIDVIITGSLDVFFLSAAPLQIIREWVPWLQRWRYYFNRKRPIGNSSVFAFNAGEPSDQNHIYDIFMRAPDEAFANFRNEQRFLCHYAKGLAFWEKGLCLSFKRDLMRLFPFSLLSPSRRLPPKARIVAFHGRPLPEEVVKGGFWGKRLKRGFGAVKWAQKSWKNA